MNKKLEHLERLVGLCGRIQSDLLREHRSTKNDIIISMLYDLVAQYPLLPVDAFHTVYRLLQRSISEHNNFVYLLRAPGTAANNG